jgi:hypothetical protein
MCSHLPGASFSDATQFRCSPPACLILERILTWSTYIKASTPIESCPPPLPHVSIIYPRVLISKTTSKLLPLLELQQAFQMRHDMTSLSPLSLFWDATSCHIPLHFVVERDTTSPFAFPLPRPGTLALDATRCHVPSRFVLGCDVMLCPLALCSGTRHHVVLPRALFWDTTSCCVASHFILGCDTMLRPCASFWDATSHCAPSRFRNVDLHPILDVLPLTPS